MAGEAYAVTGWESRETLASTAGLLLWIGSEGIGEVLRALE
jgi:hypothetical protein